MTFMMHAVDLLLLSSFTSMQYTLFNLSLVIVFLVLLFMNMMSIFVDITGSGTFS